MKSEKQLMREQIIRQTNAYLDAGGQINEVGYLVTTDEKIQLKRNENSKERATYVSGAKGEFE